MKNDLFRVSELLADEMKRFILPSMAQRLLLAIIYLDERQANAQAVDDDGNFCIKPKWASISEFRSLGLAPQSGSSRFLRSPVAILATSGLFDSIHIAQDGKSVMWILSAMARELLSGEIYGLASAKDIGACSHAFDAVIYAHSVVRFKMDRPKFRMFPFDAPSGRSFLLGSLGEEHFFDAKEMTRKIKPSLGRIARLKNLEYFVEYAQTGSQRGYTEVRIKFRHHASAWQERDFMRSHPRSHSYTINGKAPSVN